MTDVKDNFFFLWNVVECHSIERKFSIKVHGTCTWVQYLSKSNRHSDAQSTERLKDTLTCPACQYEICLPRRFFLPDKCSHWQLVFYTHTSTYAHTPLLVTVSHYPLFHHIMDTLQIEYLVQKMFSQGSGAFAHIRLAVLPMYYWCVLFVFLGLVVILLQHNNNCSYGI